MIALKRFTRKNDGAAAIEFAILAPVFILLLLTFIGYGLYLGAAHSLQQLAADASRAAIAGLSEAERQKLASDFVLQSTVDHAFINPDKLEVTVQDDTDTANKFTVQLRYDASNLPIWSLYAFALPGKTISRASTIRIGGV